MRDSRWAVPPALDPGDYRPSAAAPGWMSFRSSFVARAADGQDLPVAITRRMRLEAMPGAADALRIRFQHELTNTSATVIRNRIGLWSIIQLPCQEKGTVLFRLTPGAADAARVPHPYFTELPPDVVHGTGTIQFLEVKGGRKYKVGVAAAASAGVVTHLRPARAPKRRESWILTAQKLTVDRDGVYLDKPDYTGGGSGDNGDAAQAYNDTGTGPHAFCEIEAHAPAVEVPAGASQIVEIEILIARADRTRMNGILAGELGFDTGVERAFRG